jgi:hypothetical protein
MTSLSGDMQALERRGCGRFRPHEEHEHSTATATFLCPGVAAATPSQRQAVEDLINVRKAASTRARVEHPSSDEDTLYL